jgi:hypothetical protein
MVRQIIRNTGEGRSQVIDLQQLDKMAGELMVTALTLSPGVQRRDSIIAVGSFHRRIAAMKRSRLEAAPTGL